MKNSNDMKGKEALGLNKAITRRDLLNGITISAAASAVSGLSGFRLLAAEIAHGEQYAPEKDPNYYPPSRTGIRGSHSGSFESAHSKAWTGKEWGDVKDLGEEYDLIVIGGGISGLAAAFSYQQKKGINSRILIIDNHDDFGGHAKRVEFQYEGRTYLVPGGSGFMETPYYSKQAIEFLYDIGVNLEKLEEGQVKDLRFHAFDMSSSICFDKGTYGEAVTLVDEILPMNRKDENGGYNLVKHIPDMPISETAKKELHNFLTTEKDLFEKLSQKEREIALHSMSYYTFVTKYGGLSKDAADALFTRQTGAIIGVTADCSSLYDAVFLSGLPALHALGEQGEKLQMELDNLPPIEGHYGPEGNAIITRNIVKRLIPDVCDANTMEELETERFDYSKLDSNDSNVKIRLNSTCVNIRHIEDGKRVLVKYIRGNRAYSVKTSHCIYAGWHVFLPYICPELPEAQREALSENVKMPFVAANVFLRNGKPLQELGTASFYFPGRFLHECLGWGRSLGKHKQDFNPDEPVIIYMIGPVVSPHTGQNPQDQYRQGRYRLLSMSFEDYEIEVREQLRDLFASTSFDVSEDIIGLTINRWSHGYSRQYNSLFDPDYVEGQRPHEIARTRFGRIAIANSDAGYVALAHVAIDEGLRAADELAEQKDS